MADTKYRVFKLHDVVDVEKESGTHAMEGFVLLPGEYEGSNPARRAAEEWGEGDYIAVPLSSFKRHGFQLETAPRIRPVK